MRKTAYWLFAAIILTLGVSGCMEGDDVRPALMSEEVQLAVQGKWSIERIESQLCRDNNCTSESYTGNTTDYFEFRADSAFLVRLDAYNKSYNTAYKLNYRVNPGFILLNSGSWNGRFEVKEVKASKMVLINSFTGQDPKAIFTDTYYLFR
ncbi:lipocalin family protein [Pontibacter sp. 13R65]|uniref:lipocalin family protein n=1 Tax=Pontibacter sp. 13R65 TaxID=3127458 RepID=UPI00301CB4CA